MVPPLPLPPPPDYHTLTPCRKTLQHTTTELTRALSSLTTLLTSTTRPAHDPLRLTPHDFLTTAHVHTLPAYPGARHRDMLYTMLRKKLDLGVEDWFCSLAALPDGDDDGSGQGALGREELRALWGSAPLDANRIARGMWGAGKDDGSESEEESEDDDEMEDVVGEDGALAVDGATRRASAAEAPDVHARKMMDLTQILPFALTGSLGLAPMVPPGRGR